MNDDRTKGWLARRLPDLLGHYVIAGWHVLLDPSLSDGAARMYLDLRLIAGNRLSVTLTHAELSSLLNIREREVGNRKNELQDAGLVTVSSSGRAGATWTFLPPSVARMHDVHDFMSQASVRIKPAPVCRPAVAGQPYPPRLANLTGWGGLDTRTTSSNIKRQITGDESTPPAPQVALSHGELDLEVLAQWVSSSLWGIYIALMAEHYPGALLRIPQRDRLVHRHDVLPLIEAGFDWRDLQQLWSIWLDDVATQGRLQTFVYDPPKERRAWYDFVDWLLSAGEVVEPGARPALPVPQILDIKTASRVVRAAATRRQNQADRHMASTMSVRATDVRRMSITAVGFVASMEELRENWRVILNPGQPVHDYAAAMSDHRAGLIGVAELGLTLVNAVDELLDLGHLPQGDAEQTYPEPGQVEAPPCGVSSRYHLRKHELIEQQETCARCMQALQLHHGGAWMESNSNAVIHESTLWCSTCVANLVDETDPVK